ncbi:hypothetical protein AAZX31_11G081100 [Glycine max]|uniref:DUF241 domain-containing protein n=2 Tax=Glycine subgen. Soja TaxID=1462606 RepID=I1LI82_SOYBN|nr:uncharacterized protein LOC100820514 [Glycine max]XP_028186904.1 uncharacterized protein LOC114373605 [Glycine soja]KAG4973491.1 hypothetical protein JHK87_030312 [Glycine soja]KAG4988064.1 hypothetical protein JHK85_031047 [Glycine max]KAG4993680.1 hypothetical protein JHK86_030507 [Glycine max]KAG5123675.1 hypothetical protein JHK82_030412 [Glycine max]KAG5145090.1 hypothetical protein JHK84_030633 [Glycine max]|eukprot:XP_003537672.1 uncharacterized protein LOC100820514 [Glycine max]
MANMYHVRSNSFPSGSHPCSIRIEEELSKMKTWEATSTSTSESIGTGLSLLEDLYICLEDLLNVASTQKVISNHKGEKCMEELFDGSVGILDICGITRNTMSQVKENVQALHSSLRRRKGDSSIEKSVAEYNFLTKKMKKNAKKLMASLKQMESKFGVSPILNQDQDLASVIKVLREVITMNMLIFQSLLSYLAWPASKSKATKWLMVARLMHKKRVISCDEESQNVNELQCVEASLSTLLSEGTNVSKLQGVRDRLEALENAIESLENGLERMFKRLVRTRANLLNIMTQ